jgi:4-amino-4-deoxychorismate lyase
VAAQRTLINGRLGDSVSVTDRGLLYGDGLFETVAVRGRQPCLWQRHLARLARGCARLAIPPPDAALLGAEVQALLAAAPAPDGVLKLIVTRGSGPRGYAPPAEPAPTRILTFAAGLPGAPKDAEDGIRLTLCDTRLGDNARLAGIKHLNRLEQVLARAEWTDPAVQDGIMCDNHGQPVCCTAANLFAVSAEGIVTPPLDRSGVAGTVRELVREHACALGIGFIERALSLPELLAADGLFISNALRGVLPVARIRHRCYDPSAVPAALLARVRQAALEPETPA